MEKYNYLFIDENLLNKLNTLGYVHFSTKEQITTCKNGKAFYFCKGKKEYGYVDVVPYSEIDNIKDNADYLDYMVTIC